MEEEGFIVTFLGSKSLLQYDDSFVERIKNELVQAELSTFISEVKKMGFDQETTCDLIKEYWNKGKE